MMQRLWIFSWIWLIASCLCLTCAIIHLNRVSAKSGAGLDKSAGTGHVATDKPTGLLHKISPNGHQANITNGLPEEAADQNKAISGLAKQGKWDESTAALNRFSVKTNIVIGEEKKVDYTSVDLSDVGSTRSKIEKILERYEDANHVVSVGDPVKQIIGLGEDAIEPLLAMLLEEGADTITIREALEGLLTEKHRDLIIKYFNEKNIFTVLIKNYGFKEAKESVMTKLSELQGGGRESDALVDAALKYDSDRAIKILMARMKEGYIVANAAERLASVPDLDMTDTFRQAIEKAQGNWDREKLLTPMIEKGMPESLDMALKILKPGGLYYVETENDEREWVCRQISNYTGVLGTVDEITAWLEKNRNNLIWNPDTRHFEFPGGK